MGRAAVPAEAEKKAEAAKAAKATELGSPRKGFQDVEGALGPNRLPRMKGGNPSSPEKCDRLPNCPFQYCSFKH